MKATKRIFTMLLSLVLLFGLCPAGVFAASDEIEPDTGQGEAEATDEEPAPVIDFEVLSSVEDIIPEEDFTGESGVIQLDETTTVEYETATEDNRAEALAEIMETIAGNDLQTPDEEPMPDPDGELLATETDATLYLAFADTGSAVAVSTDDGTKQQTMLYYISETDGILYCLAPDDLAVEEPAEVDEDGRAVIALQRGTSVRLSVIEGYGHAITSVTISPDMEESTELTYDFVMEDDVTLAVATAEAAVSIPAGETEFTSVQVREKNGVMINDPTVTLPAEESSTGSAGKGPRKISGNYWGEISARYEGGGTHPYPNGSSTGVFTVNYGGTYYTGICIDPSYGAPGSAYVNQWRDWYYYNVPIRDNATFFAAIAASYYSNNGSVDHTVAYINQRNRKNWDQVGTYLYSWCRWDRVIDNSNFGHGFAMYHELLGYLANDWTWDRSVLGTSAVKSNIESCCSAISRYCDPGGSDFRQNFYNILYTYHVFYYQSTTAGKQRVAWTVPRTDYGTVTIKKVSSKTGEPLPNCTITLTDINDPNHTFTATTGEDGIAKFEWVTWTTYTVEEIEPPEDYLLSYEAEDVAFTASYTFKSIADDPATGTLTVVKLDHETKTPLAGATFRLYNAEGNIFAEATTGSDGTITIEDIPYGDYTYQEIEAPPYFQRDDTIYNLTINGGDELTHTREDIRIPGSITVLKTDEDGNRLPGVTYLLQYSTDGGRTWQPVYARTDEDVLTGGCTSAGLTDGKLITGADGIAKFEGLRADGVILYKLTETSTQNGKTLLTEPVYVGTLPQENGDSDPIYDISYTVADGTVFRLPATGYGGFAYMPLALLCLVPTIYFMRRRRRA